MSDVRSGNVMVLLTIASVVASTVIAVKVLSPLLHVAAVFPFYYSAMRRHRHGSSLALVIRWGAALGITTLVVGVFVPGRLASSLPYAHQTRMILEMWLANPDAPPPADYSYLMWGMVMFLAGSVISGGLLGFLVGSIALGGVAYGALFLFEHGTNVLPIALTAVPLWQWAVFLSAAFWIVPAAYPFFERILKTDRGGENLRTLRAYMIAGGALFVASLVLRLTMAGALQRMLQRLTVL